MKGGGRKRGVQMNKVATAKTGREPPKEADQQKIANPAATADRRIRRTRNAIRNALQELLHGSPLEQITIREIADKADVSYTTFFRHYPDKEAVLADLADEQTVRLLDLCLPLVNVPNEESFAACLATCRYVDKDRILWTALLTGGAAGAIRSSFIRRTLEKAVRMPRAHDWLPLDIGTTLAVGITLDLLGWWLSRASQKPPEEIAEMLDSLLASIVRRKKP